MPVSAANLPAEVWLEIIPHIPYSPKQLSCLCLTCHKLNDLVKNHEHSLVNDIKQTQILLDSSPDLSTFSTSLKLFPGLNLSSYSDLNTLWRRMETLESLNNKWLHIVTSSEEFHWLEGRWTGVHKAGLLLLYRLQDTKTYEEKLDILYTLPGTSLACLLFKLISSIKILRVFGPEPIHLRYGLGDVSIRSDIELACEELILQHGPEFFVSLLGNNNPSSCAKATDLLLKEFTNMEARQLPDEDGKPRPPTLISSLRRALSAVSGCRIPETVSKMWEILSCTAFDDLDDKKLGMIVRGEEVKCGFRRMGF